ncbi:MAG: hypothetical protein PHG91_05040 [Syntrophales bacterium]|nr:hypothetical protein [Syntrophales bacterium]
MTAFNYPFIRCVISIPIILIAYAVPAWGNPCYSRAVSFKSVPHDKPFTLTLEAGRVKSVNENAILYDLGKEIITIEAESFTAQRFLENVARGRCSARETVRLKPARKSPFNTRFTAVTSKPRSR